MVCFRIDASYSNSNNEIKSSTQLHIVNGLWNTKFIFKTTPSFKLWIWKTILLQFQYAKTHRPVMNYIDGDEIEAI